jgi:hypothetical protein
MSESEVEKRKNCFKQNQCVLFAGQFGSGNQTAGGDGRFTPWIPDQDYYINKIWMCVSGSVNDPSATLSVSPFITFTVQKSEGLVPLNPLTALSQDIYGILRLNFGPEPGSQPGLVVSQTFDFSPAGIYQAKGVPLYVGMEYQGGNASIGIFANLTLLISGIRTY